MSTLLNEARTRVPRIAEAAVERARLTVVPRTIRAAPRVPFVSLVSLLLVGRVAGLLFFNTSMQQTSFTATAMEQEAHLLDAREQSLKMQLDALRDPQRVALQAKRMGMQGRAAPLSSGSPTAWCSASRSPATRRLDPGHPAAHPQAQEPSPAPGGHRGAREVRCRRRRRGAPRGRHRGRYKEGPSP